MGGGEGVQRIDFWIVTESFSYYENLLYSSEKSLKTLILYGRIYEFAHVYNPGKGRLHSRHKMLL